MANPTSLSSDEALARALQKEYEQEARSSRRQLSAERPPPTAPNHSPGTSARMPPSNNLARGTSERMSSEQADAAYARSLERDMRAQQSSRSFENLDSTTQPTSRASNFDGNLTEDEEYARRVEQELEDEEVARRLSSREEERASRQRATVVAGTAQPSRQASRGPVRKACGYIIPLAVMGGIAFGLYYLFSGDDVNIPGFPDNWGDFSSEDPFNQTSPEGADRWSNKGKGLSLEVVNALDSEWYEFFYESIRAWDDGSPDVLSLSTSVRTPDSTGQCASLDGKIKVCNSNYGETNWRGTSSEMLRIDLCSFDRVFIHALTLIFIIISQYAGINQVLIRNDVIFASSAKMNDYYLSGNNRDTGECMDYTSNPQNNDQPGTVNFEFLEALYGTLPSSGNGQSVEASSKVPGNRELESEGDSLPEWLTLALDQVIPSIENRVDGNEHEDGWRLLHQSRGAAAHEMDLGNGVTVQVHKLLVESDSD
jgi:hypothetical protein